jgi:hypothetical protein
MKKTTIVLLTFIAYSMSAQIAPTKDTIYKKYTQFKSLKETQNSKTVQPNQQNQHSENRSIVDARKEAIKNEVFLTALTTVSSFVFLSINAIAKH